MQLFADDLRNAFLNLSNIQLTALIFGYLAAMLSMMVAMEIRMEHARNPPDSSWVRQRFPIILCYIIAIWFTSVFTWLALPIAKSDRFSITAIILTFVVWTFIILTLDYLTQRFKHKAGLFKLFFAMTATSSYVGAHSSFLFLPNSSRIESVYWPGIAAMYVVAFLGMISVSRFAQQTSNGMQKRTRDRLVYVFLLILINQGVVLSLICFVEMKRYVVPESNFWLWMGWKQFDSFVSLVSLGMILSLIYKVYSVLDSSLVALKTDSENLKKMNRIALQEVASASDSLRVKQDKIAQLEKVIVSAKTEHLLSVEGLLAALSTLEEGMFEWDLEEEIIEMSMQWVNVFGFADRSTTRQKVPDWKAGFIADDLHLIEAAVESLLMGVEQAVSTQARYRTPSGGLLKLEMRMASVQNPYGLSGKVVGIFHDRTEEMDLELSIRQELSEESILSTRKTQFVSYLAHEIRTPMTIITSAKALLESNLKRISEVPDRIYQYIDQIGTALGALRGLVDETLMFMGTTYPKSQLSVERVDLQSLLSRFSEVEQKRRFLGKPIQITSTEELEGCEFYSDEAIISQAIRHLANFAVDHLSERSTIEVGFHQNVLSFQYCMKSWPVWMVRAGELEPLTDSEVVVPFSDEFLPFSLLITKRVIRLVNGKIMIKSLKGEHRLIAEMPSLREGLWLES